MMKRLLSLVLALFLLVGLVACGPEHIEDTNGVENFELQVITDENIRKMDIGSLSYVKAETVIGDTVTYKTNKFSGVAEVFHENIITNRFEITVNHARVDAGNFKMVLCVDDEIVHTFALNELSQIFVLEDVRGTVSLRIAGESAKFQFDYKVD